MNLFNIDDAHATRSVSAFFETRAAAEQAKADVVATGVSGEAVKITDGRGTITGNASAVERDGTGVIDTIKHAFKQDDHSYADELERRGFVLTAHVPGDHYDQVLGIVGRDGEVTQERV